MRGCGGTRWYCVAEFQVSNNAGRIEVNRHIACDVDCAEICRGVRSIGYLAAIPFGIIAPKTSGRRSPGTASRFSGGRTEEQDGRNKYEETTQAKSNGHGPIFADHESMAPGEIGKYAI